MTAEIGIGQIITQINIEHQTLKRARKEIIGISESCSSLEGDSQNFMEDGDI